MANYITVQKFFVFISKQTCLWMTFPCHCLANSRNSSIIWFDTNDLKMLLLLICSSLENTQQTKLKQCFLGLCRWHIYHRQLILTSEGNTKKNMHKWLSSEKKRSHSTAVHSASLKCRDLPEWRSSLFSEEFSCQERQGGLGLPGAFLSCIHPCFNTLS